MYLSQLLIDIGDNPDRPRPGRTWLRNIYHVHQRLCMAFPSAPRASHDPDFLQPFKPEDFDKHVHVARAKDAGFLFRIDPHLGGRVMILLQSAAEPDWDYAFHNASYLLAAPPEMRLLDPSFALSERLKFRILANPVRRVSPRSLDAKGRPLDKKWIGKRVPVPHNKLEEWLTRKADNSGFHVERFTAIQPGYVYMKGSQADPRSSGDKGNRLFSARFEGILEVTDADAFYETLVSGIGPAKAFGFGLLSVAPV